MMSRILQFAIQNKLIILLFMAGWIAFGVYSLTRLNIGAVPDITNNQVQIITTSRNLSTQDVEEFITYPVELEMANLPGVKEIRSISKFGLSVVTVVFEDEMGSYLPRQLINEKLDLAAQKIPEGFGKPFMGPITTGLGEIYQYVLEVAPGYEHRYTTMDLRTIQDWQVKRQLAGIPGVVEINTWGGYLKQYEVGVQPEKLRTYGLNLADVFHALVQNNSVAGGAYIERAGKSYFVRGQGMITNLDDIRNIVLPADTEVPVYVRDVATVSFGHANRFGAITGNAEGEKVLGQVMMLKGANSKKVIEDVKKRVEEVSKNLPEGISINAFLDRSELIEKTTHTITENLVLGALIVIFVVVILIGNLRSGLLVASVIPLSLLFAFGCMYLFGISANLMSLGAIDFGIIIDGSVIIVEFVSYRLGQSGEKLKNLPPRERKLTIDKTVLESTHTMMRSAIFGQIIILIVFIPILSLSGVEGKMFKPMAYTFCFALIGAIILCFTYVPVVASLLITPRRGWTDRMSARLISFLKSAYEPVINMALGFKKVVVALCLLLFGFTLFVFLRLGGEFVPTLDEGDFVIQPVYPTGTSLKETIALSTRIEKILLTFPEVDQVVTRIGAAEVPTDPMSMEETDAIIKLAPRSEWVTANSKDQLAAAFKEALAVLPGVEIEFTQPIEMRFNELITGVRADVAIKVFGEDLEELNRIAESIKRNIAGTEGAADIVIEKVVGLPQMSVQYNRSQLAKYGLNVQTLNHHVEAAFAGKSAGSIFEGEQRFDLVVRLDSAYRQDMEKLRNLTVTSPVGRMVALREVADISYSAGPAKISRDDTHRRIVIGVNVRNRDLESVVNDIQEQIEETIDLPPGYYITYGGQFEQLRMAKARLAWAVPVALLLIFVMLYIALKSLKKSLLVFSAIPLAAVGGVFLLAIRDMPFSISAGVGFIALFGIAVLNGIVLMEHFNQLRHQDNLNMDQLVKTGAMDRLRPVLLTASAAALGFLPMAISTSAGAEVQRPLATVVIGGLFTATLLTLVVLPVLYALWFSSSSKSSSS